MTFQHYPSPTTALGRFTNAWVRASAHATTSALEANRAAIAALSPPHDTRDDSVEAVTYSDPDWELDRTVTDPDEISVGDTVRFTKRFTDDDVTAFADASGDTNRLHLDDDYAGQTRFGNRIVHGTLVAGLISAALARLPGLTIYLSQDLDFHAPVQIGARVTAHTEVVEALDDNRYRLTTEVTDENTTYITGEAVVLVDPHPPETQD